MTNANDAIESGIAAMITAIDPMVERDLDSDPSAYLRLIAITAEINARSGQALQSSVTSARTAGVTWSRISDVLHVSRQAAQKRFAEPLPAANSQTWRMSPVTAFDEIERLNEAGKSGWHSIGFGALYHDLELSNQQWEHRRVSVFAPHHALESEGWQRIGNMWFPWIYYARNTGKDVTGPVQHD